MYSLGCARYHPRKGLRRLQFNTRGIGAGTLGSGHDAAMKRTNLLASLLVLFLVFLAGAAAQNASPAPAQTQPAAKVSHATKAINYLQKGATKVGFRATGLMPGASAEAKVQAKSGRTEVEIKADNLVEPTGKFGFEYLTYVVWALSPQGRAANLGELILDHGSSKIRATTELQTFALIVTAEPYFAVTQPSNLVVLENASLAGGSQADIDFTYELVGRGAYSATNERIDNAIFGIDPRTPLALFEARNAVRIARLANAAKYAAAALAKAEKSLKSAEDTYRGGSKGTTIAFAREAAQIAEDARVMSVKQEQQERQQREAAEREAKARADAEAEARRRQEAEEARLAAETAKADAERMKQEAEKARADAEAARASAETARAAAEQQGQQLAVEADKARKAAAEADRLRQQAEKEKSELRARLLQQLNSVLETRDSARGLIANMGDVLFQTGKFELKPAARERLARVSGLLLAYFGLQISVEGHTDNIGGDEYNQKLSEQRAEAVRSYLIESGVPETAVTARGFGKTQPVAENGTADGRQKNRRVELVVSGDAIGGSTGASVEN